MNNINKTVYGPVKSRRFGQSLGIDPLFQSSICSFNCIYCQLGNIQIQTLERKIYVPTDKIISDFKEISEDFDVISISGCGEPTLAENLNEIIFELRKLTGKPILILTNGSLLNEISVKKSLLTLDHVVIKLDCIEQKLFEIMNRPLQNIKISEIIKNIKDFTDSFNKAVDLQIMLMPLNSNDKNIEDLCKIIKEINPSQIQLNTPSRPYPLIWHRENRGRHEDFRDYEIRHLQNLDTKELQKIKNKIIELTALNVISV